MLTEQGGADPSVCTHIRQRLVEAHDRVRIVEIRDHEQLEGAVEVELALRVRVGFSECPVHLAGTPYQRGVGLRLLAGHRGRRHGDRVRRPSHDGLSVMGMRWSWSRL